MVRSSARDSVTDQSTTIGRALSRIRGDLTWVTDTMRAILAQGLGMLTEPPWGHRIEQATASHVRACRARRGRATSARGVELGAVFGDGLGAIWFGADGLIRRAGSAAAEVAKVAGGAAAGAVFALGQLGPEAKASVAVSAAFGHGGHAGLSEREGCSADFAVSITTKVDRAAGAGPEGRVGRVSLGHVRPFSFS